MMRRKYIHDLPDWPRFRWDLGAIAAELAAVRHDQGLLAGHMGALGFESQRDASALTIAEDVIRSSEIEGEHLDAAQVRSSVGRRLGLDVAGLPAPDRDVEGIVEMTLDATSRYAEPLSAERLFGWHASLFPTGRSGLRSIITGSWRDDATGPMQVVSGPLGRERVHFEAPAAERVDAEMQLFFEWFNTEQLDDVLRSAVAHLWFVTVHPFADGNGRIARAISDLALARSEGSPRRFYSMSAQIRRERNVYYDTLERTQRGDLDITPWLSWFLACLGRAIGGAHEALAGVTRKADFWRLHAGATLNARQREMLNRLLDSFEGKLTTTKWAKITKTSPDTALRDITQLVELGILVRGSEGGRSTSYALADPDGVAAAFNSRD